MPIAVVYVVVGMLMGFRACVEYIWWRRWKRGHDAAVWRRPLRETDTRPPNFDLRKMYDE